MDGKKQDLQSRVDVLTEIVLSARNILNFSDFEDSAKNIFELCKKITGAKSGYVALLSDDGRENEVLFLDSGGLDCTVDENLPMPIRGLRSEAYKTGKPAYNNDFMKSEWVKFMPEGHVILKNVMFSPINIDKKTVGIVGLANKDGDFSELDAENAAF